MEGREHATDAAAIFGEPEPDDERRERPTATPKSIVSQIVIVLLTEQRVAKAELRALVEPCSDVQFALALHHAREQIRRDQRIEFIPGASGELVRASEPQKVGRGLAFARAASAKRKRSLAVLDAVDVAGLTEDEKQRHALASDKQRQLVALEQATARKRAVSVSDGNGTHDRVPLKT